MSGQRQLGVRNVQVRGSPGPVGDPRHLDATHRGGQRSPVPALGAGAYPPLRAGHLPVAFLGAGPGIELVLHQAVANAVEHTDTEEVRVVIQHHPPTGRLICAVHDSSTNVPAESAERPSLDAESGRGLHLMESLSEAWGHLVRPDGKWTWFSLRPFGAQS
ncbi:hypothetical protein ABH940_003388 [Streptacidiphilus sp. BW17]|uniref:ATP-binding protein n=1 Tax=Streptacidiphilus sp. BW17 TaxID=3156274 RepID=UPI0035192F21